MLHLLTSTSSSSSSSSRVMLPTAQIYSKFQTLGRKLESKPSTAAAGFDSSFLQSAASHLPTSPDEAEPMTGWIDFDSEDEVVDRQHDVESEVHSGVHPVLGRGIADCDMSQEPQSQLQFGQHSSIVFYPMQDLVQTFW